MADSIIENPTYMEHVRHFFDDEDLEHMFDRNTDLTTYPALKDAASLVFQHTRPPNAHMPPEPERKWSQERFQSFRNWMDNGFPLGAPNDAALQTRVIEAVKDTISRSRNQGARVTQVNHSNGSQYFRPQS